jgi:hypothetical protein
MDHDSQPTSEPQRPPDDAQVDLWSAYYELVAVYGMDLWEAWSTLLANPTPELIKQFRAEVRAKKVEHAKAVSLII